MRPLARIQLPQGVELTGQSSPMLRSRLGSEAEPVDQISPVRTDSSAPILGGEPLRPGSPSTASEQCWSFDQYPRRGMPESSFPLGLIVLGEERSAARIPVNGLE